MPINSDYHPNIAVRGAHHIPRLTTHLTSGSNTFILSNKTYYEDLIVFPVIILILGMLSVIIYMLLMLFRCCCTCLRCVPMSSRINDIESYNDEEYIVWSRQITKSRVNLIIFSSILMIILVIANHIQFQGNAYLNTGTKQAADSLSTLANYFNSIATSSSDMSTQSNAISSYITSAEPSCLYIVESGVDYNQYTDSISSAATSIHSIASKLPSKLSNYHDLVLYYGGYVKDLVVYILYAVVMIPILLHLIGLYFRSKIFNQIAIFISVLLVIAFTIICPIEMIILELLGDICINPSKNLVSAFPKGDTQQVLRYYTSCTGSNPLSNDLANSTTYSNLLNSTLSSLNQGCPDNYYLSQINQPLDAIFADISSLEDDILCTPLYNVSLR